MPTARILLVADTHLGFDLPFHPRVDRRRRGPDFFANFERALSPALRGEVDLVVHGGDLFYRSRVPTALVEMAMAPLLRVAEAGVPVYLVPGNHERSNIPLHLMTAHPLLHIFDKPRTYLCATAGASIALSGFPFVRDVRSQFASLVAQTRAHEVTADAHLLCIHQAVEGAQVGVHNYTFRDGPDVVMGREIPSNVAAVLAGHIHRAQALRRDLRGRQLAAPVIYPGSVERTAFAEREEPKGYILLRVDSSDAEGNSGVSASFVRLPARPMAWLTLCPDSADAHALREQVASRLLTLDPNAVVCIHLEGPCSGAARDALTATVLRKIAPSTMNVSLSADRRAWASYYQRPTNARTT
jgi:exonuclease SbcD